MESQHESLRISSTQPADGHFVNTSLRQKRRLASLPRWGVRETKGGGDDLFLSADLYRWFCLDQSIDLWWSVLFFRLSFFVVFTYSVYTWYMYRESYVLQNGYRYVLSRVIICMPLLRIFVQTVETNTNRLNLLFGMFITVQCMNTCTVESLFIH